jgi:hypothetical protein
MKKIAVLICLIVLFNLPNAVRALDTDIYVLTYAQIQIQPDALFVVDLSGSMKWTPAGGQMYISSAESCGSNVAYYPNSGTGHTKACTIDPYGTVPKFGDAACLSPFYRTSGTGHTIDCSRIAIAKRAIFNVLDDDNNGTVNADDETSLGLRFGFMRFTGCTSSSSDGTNYNSGCNQLINGLGTSYSSIWTSVNTQTADQGTHLAAALNEARIYLNDNKSHDDAADCRQKFVILITDGADTLACSGSGSEDQQTQYKRRRETVAKVKALSDAGYKVFVVGFGADMPHWLRNTLNWAARYGGTRNSSTTQSGDESAYNPSSVTSCQNSSTTHHNVEGDGDHYYATAADPGEISLSGYAFLASSADELSTTIKSIAKYIAQMMKESISYVAPVVPISQMEKTSAGNRIYLGMFKPADKSFWKGNIKKFGIATEDDGDIKVGTILDVSGSLVMNDMNVINPNSRSYWSTYTDGVDVEKGGTGAAMLDRDLGTNPRKLYTYLGTNIDLTDGSNAFNLSNTGPTGITPERVGLAPGDTTGRNQIINFIHGLDAYDWNGPCGPPGPDDPQDGIPDLEEVPDSITNAKRCWGLGAYIHSRPLILHYGTNQSLIFAGGNDGMLHAFDDATGEELWGFIPPSVLTKLKKLNGPLVEFFVDGSPKVYVERDGSDNIVKAILIFGLRRGGDHYIALDVTDRLYPKFLWEISPSGRVYGTTTYTTTDYKELGQTWSTPEIGRIKNGSGEKWVLFIAAGYDTNQDNVPVLASDTRGRGIYVVDVLTGSLIWRYTRDEDPTRMVYSIPSDIARVDVNGDGRIDRLYVGDMGGKLWRFDIGDAADVASWSGNIIFNAQGKMFYAPDVTLEKDAGNYEMLFFGTGDRENPKGELTNVNRLYAVKDKPPYPHSPMIEDDLKDVTLDLLQEQEPTITDSDKTSILNDLKTKYGWFIKLDQKPGEKCLSSPVVFYGVAYYTTFAPTVEGQSNICHLGPGSGIFYAVDYKTGKAAFNLDVTNDEMGETIVKRSDRGKVIGAAIPSGVVITFITGVSVGYVGVGGGVYTPMLPTSKSLIPVNWRIKF